MKSTVWWHWYIVWLKLNKKKRVQCDGTGTRCDGTFYEWTKKVQCEGTGTLYVKKKQYSVMALIQEYDLQMKRSTVWGHWYIVCWIWTEKKKYSVMALVQKCDGTCLCMNRKYSVRALVHCIWEKKNSVMALHRNVIHKWEKYSVRALVHYVLI